MTTQADREKAANVLADARTDEVWRTNNTKSFIDHVAAALAEEREKARAAVANDLSDLVTDSGSNVLSRSVLVEFIYGLETP